MTTNGSVPAWVSEKVLPKIGGPVRGVHAIGPRHVAVFLQDGWVLARRGFLGGVAIQNAQYPTGLLLNGSQCPHCDGPIHEPVAKIARLADDAAPSTEKGELTEKQLAQRTYAAKMRHVRERAAKQQGGKGPIRERAAAKKLRRDLGLKP